jgi:hypothetical protein
MTERSRDERVRKGEKTIEKQKRRERERECVFMIIQDEYERGTSRNQMCNSINFIVWMIKKRGS